MFIKGFRVVVLLLMVVLCMSCAQNDASQKKLRIASIPSEDAAKQQLHMQPLVSYLSDFIGMEVELEVTDDYNAAIESLRFGHVEMAWLGPFSYVLARDIVDITPVVGGIRKDTNDIYYNSIIVVSNDAEIRDLEDLKGHTFAFVDPASTSGYLFPLAKFKDIGINPEKDFKHVVFAGSHTAVELALAHGQVDGIGDSKPSYDLMVENGEIDPKLFTVLWVSDPIPPSPIVVRSDLSDDLIRRIQKAFLSMPPDTIAFEGEISGYKVVNDSDYDVIRSVANQVGINGGGDNALR
jgi:phosphonate transport system substrate-binding protein